MEKFLNQCRHLIWLPVIGCIVLTFGAVVMGVGRLVTGFIYRFKEFDFSAKSAKVVSVAIIEIIDLFLVATVAYITAVGLYKLFINKDYKLPGLLVIRNLNDLESKIIGVIVAALAVAFLGQATEDSPKEILTYGAGVASVIIALAVFVNFTSGKSKPGMIGKDKEKSIDE